MVSLGTTVSEYILRDISSVLLSKLKAVDPCSIELAFSLWIFPKGRDIIQPRLPINFAVTNYSHVAHLGFLMEIEATKFSEFKQQLEDGLTRATERPAKIVGVGPATFCNDAVALLGLALGAKHLGGQVQNAVSVWMRSFPSLPLNNVPSWKKTIINVAKTILDDSNELDKTKINQDTADLQLALLSRGLNYFPNIKFDDVYHAICNGSIFQETEVPLIAVRLQAINYLSNHLPLISLGQPTSEQVVKVLRNLTNAFRRWIWEDKPKTSTSMAQKWNLQNEYHVQSLLYFILAPIFPDIESEFYLENTGQLNPRADIGLPSLNLIIEVKFLRRNKNFQSMLEEIAADATLYFKDDGVYKDKYSKMLVFLWDDTNRDHEHGTFENAVSGFKNVTDVVVMSRPGIMTK